MQKIFGIALAGFLAVGAFVSGTQIGQSASGSNQMASLFGFFTNDPIVAEPVATTSLDEFWTVWNLLDEKFATASSSDLLSDEEKIQGAIDGLVDAYGDPYTVYLPPVDSQSFAADISGEFSGVGMEVGLRDGLITVIAPLPNTPAEQAGLIAGDVIVSIDETSTEGMRIDEAVRLIRGERGTAVTLTVFREGASEFQDITVIRDTIEIPTIETEQIDNTFIISLYSFNEVSEGLVRDALREFRRSNADTLVLDVRGNPGGFLGSAVGITSNFLDAGTVIVSESFVDESRNEVFRSRGGSYTSLNPDSFVVLVDQGSASASEILAGALQDHETATVIGTNTFGKGSVQELVELSDGSSLKVTIARWLTPDGRSISEGGLTPDIYINRTPADRLADADPQLDAALAFLRGETVASQTPIDALISSSSATVVDELE
jgi:carboxyl-terminal processing protease